MIRSALILLAVVLVSALAFPETPAAQTAPARSAPPQIGQSFTDCPECPEMVVVPAGEFMMGSTAEYLAIDKISSWWNTWESPKHRVSLKSFAIAKYAVTRGEFAAFVRETGYDPKGCKTYDELGWFPITAAIGATQDMSKRINTPWCAYRGKTRIGTWPG